MTLYLDDFLILGSTYQEAQSHTAMAVSLLESLGFTVNLEKSCLIPTQILTFLSFVIDSTVEALSLPQEKVVKVKSLCLKAKVTQTMSAHQLASVLGTLESCHPAIWQAPLDFRYLQIRLIQALHASDQNLDVTITLDHNSLEDLHWWVSNINSVNGSPIRPPAPMLFIITEASTTGWSMVCESQCTNGHWSDSERTQHINVLEVKAAFLALKSFLKNQSHKTVCLRMDNMTVVTHVNNRGGTHSPCLLALTLALWQWYHCDISTACTQQVEHYGRLGIEGVQRQQRVEVRPSNDFPLSQGVRNRLVCFLPIHPASPVRQLASGPRGTAHGCVDNGLGTLQGLRLSTLQCDPSCSKQSDSGQSRYRISGTHLSSTIMVATTTEPPSRTSSPPAELQTPPERPSRPSEDPPHVPQTTLSHVSCLRGQYSASLGSDRSLSFKQLSWKLAMLFSLTCPERVLALTKLDLRHCHILPEGVECMLSSLRKRGTADQLPKAFFAHFPSNSKLCLVETLCYYLKATRSFCPVIPSSKPDPLFILCVKPHKPISAPSLARWLRSLLKASGVNSDIFKAHSVHGASTTAAANSNVPLSEILKMADWSSASTFQKLYYKPVRSSTFAHGVLH